MNKIQSTKNLFAYEKGKRNDAIKKFRPEVKIKCCLCNKKVNEFGNNAEPLITNGICCNQCDMEKVLPARLKE